MQPSQKALEFKGRMLSLTRIRVVEHDITLIESQLKDFARQMPQAVVGMPVILDADNAFDIGALIASLKAVGMQPVGVTDGALSASARSWGLPVLPPDSNGKSARSVPTAQTAQAQPAYKPAKLITEPVRSGQQIYADSSDLIVLNTVSPGAEIIADGCIHVYGSLRGRAIAGAKGDTQARIFCRRLEADLVAVAGTYAVAEQMQGELRGKPVQALLVDGKLKLEKLDW
jgi:septum site-determining protein MinC